MKKKIVILTLLLLVISLLGYITYDKLILSKQKNVTDNRNKIIESLPDFSESIPFLWDYDYLYNYYFTMKDFKDNELLFNKFANNTMENTKVDDEDFYKIEKNKLYWKISDKWVLDRKIKEDILVFDINTSKDVCGTAIVLTNNSLYQIYNFYTEHEGCLNTDATIDYNNFIYESIQLPGKVEKVKSVLFPVDCDVFSTIYFEIDNKIYEIVEDSLVELMDYAKKNSITMERFDNTCGIAKGTLKINYDGALINIFDNKGDKIFVKYYIEIEDYNFIIDRNNYLYIERITYDDKPDDKPKKIDYVDIIKDIKFKKSYVTEDVENIVIKLSNNKLLKLGK